VASPIDFGGTPWTVRRVAPDIGEHTAEVLAELGYDDARIAALVADGVVNDLGGASALGQ